MKTYQVAEKPINIGAGIVRFTKSQFDSRKRKLEPVKGKAGCYTVTEPIQLKSGEIFGFDGEIGKKETVLVKEVDKKQLDPESKPEIDEE